MKAALCVCVCARALGILIVRSSWTPDQCDTEQTSATSCLEATVGSTVHTLTAAALACERGPRKITRTALDVQFGWVTEGQRAVTVISGMLISICRPTFTQKDKEIRTKFSIAWWENKTVTITQSASKNKVYHRWPSYWHKCISKIYIPCNNSNDNDINNTIINEKYNLIL